jgi:hypothetical protein
MSDNNLSNENKSIGLNEKTLLSSDDDKKNITELDSDVSEMGDDVLQEIEDIQHAIESHDIEAVEDIKTDSDEEDEDSVTFALVK